MRAPRVLAGAFAALLVASVLSGCPARRQGPAANEDPGPPVVLDPTLLDRG